VLRHPFAGFSQGLALLRFDSLKAFLGHSPGLSVSHTENIICCHSPVDTRVSWNGLSKLSNCISLVLFVDSVEGVDCLFEGLFVLLLGYVVQESKVLCLSCLAHFLFFPGGLRHFRSKKGVDGGRRHRLHELS